MKNIIAEAGKIERLIVPENLQPFSSRDSRPLRQPRCCGDNVSSPVLSFPSNQQDFHIITIGFVRRIKIEVQAEQRRNPFARQREALHNLPLPEVPLDYSQLPRKNIFCILLRIGVTDSKNAVTLLHVLRQQTERRDVARNNCICIREKLW